MIHVHARIAPQDDALAHNKKRCAVALSIKRSDSDIAWAEVDYDIIRVAYVEGNKIMIFETPTKVISTISLNDQHAGSFEPYFLDLGDNKLIKECPRPGAAVATHPGTGEPRDYKPRSYRTKKAS